LFFFDILPEVFNLSKEKSLDVTPAFIALVVGFFTYSYPGKIGINS
jgi:hypothetical protein